MYRDDKDLYLGVRQWWFHFIKQVMRTSQKNYRPISILPVVSKILEKVLVSQLTKHLQDTFLRRKSPHGFRNHLSTETEPMSVANKLYDNNYKKKIYLVTLSDFSKLSIVLSQEMLIYKLDKINIDKFWLDSYLNKRSQGERMGKNLSDKLEITFGVPQGLVLGLILLLIYRNDLRQYISDCLMVQYADDTLLIHTENIDSNDDLLYRSAAALKIEKKNM